MSTISNKKSDRSCGSVKSLNRSEEFKNVAYLEEHAELSCQTKLKRFLPSFTGPFKSLVGADKINTNLIDRYIDFRRTVKGVEVYAKYKELEANLRGSEIVLGPIAKQVANDFGVKMAFLLVAF